MWSLVKILQTPEVAKMNNGSFWDKPLRYDVNRKLFEDEKQYYLKICNRYLVMQRYVS